MIEVELKLELLPTAWSQIQKRIESMQLLRHIRNEDSYYDTAQFDLLRQAVFVRVRNQAYLEFKFNEQAAPVHIQSTERLFSLPAEQEQMREINMLFAQFLPQWRAADTIQTVLHDKGLLELAHIENQRTQYRYGEITLCVDRVKELGDFVEIEMQCEEGSDTSEVEARLQSFAASLTSGIAMRRVRVGYVELWLQKYHREAYKLGKYQE